MMHPPGGRVHIPPVVAREPIQAKVQVADTPAPPPPPPPPSPPPFDPNNPSTWPSCPAGDIVRADNGQCAASAVIPTPPPTLQSQPATSNTYDWGNCTWFVASQVNVPDNLGNANMWAINARNQGFTVSPVPIVGSVAQTSAGNFGHVAIVIGISGDQVELKEMNVQGLGVVDTQWLPTNNFNYIYF